MPADFSFDLHLTSIAISLPSDLDVIGYEPWDTKTLHGDSEDDGDVGEEEEVKGQDWDEDRQSVKCTFFLLIVELIYLHLTTL